MSIKALVSRHQASPRFLIPFQIGIAINRSHKNSNGENQEETTFVDCDAFGKTAEVINQYFHKGDPIHVEGRLRFRQWQTESQETRSKPSVIIDRFEFVKTRQDGDSTSTQPQAVKWTHCRGQNTGGNDIPF